MKILVIQHTDVIGGSLNGALDLIKMLCEFGHNVDVYINNGQGNAKKIAADNSLNLVMEELGVPTFDFFNGCNSIIRIIVKYFLSVKYKKKWKNFLKQNKYDVVILNTSVLWPLRSVIQDCKTQCWCYIRETIKGKNSDIINKIIRKQLGKCDKVFFLTRYDMTEWSLANNKQYILPEVVNCTQGMCISRNEFIREHNLDNKVFYVLYMGGMQEIKGANTIIMAMDILKSLGYERNIQLIFLGKRGDEKVSLMYKLKYGKQYRFQTRWNKFLKEKNLNYIILRFGYQRDILDWITASDVIVFPVHMVHQARPMYEAGIMNRTIIVPSYPNYRDNLINGYNGIEFEPKNPYDLAKKIISLYDDREELKKLSQNNFEMTMNNHEIGVVKDILYKSIYD